MPIFGGLFIGVVYFVLAVVNNGHYGYGTLWPAHVAFAPVANFSTFLTREIEFYGGPFLYPLYAGILWHASRNGWGRRALIELAILHSTCVAFLVPGLIDDESFSDQLDNHRINLWLLGVTAAFFVYVHIVAFRFATGRSVRDWMPAPRFSLRTMVAGMLLLASAVTLWMNRNPWVIEATLGQKEMPAFAAFSADGKRIISVGDNDSKMSTWDIATGREISSCDAHVTADGTKRKSLATPDGPMFASLGPDGYMLPSIPPPPIKLDAAFANALSQRISFESAKNLDEAIKSLKEAGHIRIEFNDEGERWSEFNQVLRINNIELKSALEKVAETGFVKIEYKESSAVFVTQSEMDRRSATQRQIDNETVRVWNLERNELLASLYMPDAVEFLISNDAKRVATWNSDGEAWFWDVTSGKLLFTVPAEWQLDSTMSFSPDGELASMRVLNGQNEELPISTILNVHSGNILWQIHFDNEYRPPAIFWRKNESRFTSFECTDLSPDGERFISLSENIPHTPLIRDVRSDDPVAQCQVMVSGKTSKFFPDGDRVVTFANEMAYIWDARTGCALASAREEKWTSVWNDFKEYFRFIDDRNYANPFDMSSNSVICQLSNDGERILIADTTYEMEEYSSATAGGRSQFLLAGTKSALKVWTRRRPEWWWGYAWLPEFWLCAAFACAFAWSTWRDFRKTGNA